MQKYTITTSPNKYAEEVCRDYPLQAVWVVLLDNIFKWRSSDHPWVISQFLSLCTTISHYQLSTP